MWQFLVQQRLDLGRVGRGRHVHPRASGIAEPTPGASPPPLWERRAGDTRGRD